MQEQHRNRGETTAEERKKVSPRVITSSPELFFISSRYLIEISRLSQYYLTMSDIILMRENSQCGTQREDAAPASLLYQDAVGMIESDLLENATNASSSPNVLQRAAFSAAALPCVDSYRIDKQASLGSPFRIVTLDDCASRIFARENSDNGALLRAPLCFGNLPWGEISQAMRIFAWRCSRHDWICKNIRE